MPVLSPENLTLLAAVALAVAIAAALAAAVLGLRLARLRRAYACLLSGDDQPRDLAAILYRQVERIDRLTRDLDAVNQEVALLRQRVRGCIRRIGFTRYDAFPDVGGQLSYSLALLDEAGDGAVLSAINGRAETRCYAKPVQGGRSAHHLSEEEEEAIALAIGRPETAVQTSA